MKFRKRKSALLSALLVAAATSALAATHARRSPASAKLLTKHSLKPTPKFQPPRGIEDARALQLQSALIHAGYLTGEPSGHWDDRSEAAMQKLQADNGWQTKLVPDSRAIIKLGLGPSTANSALVDTTAALAPAEPTSFPAQ
jgi:peptidoglycan hydrolase-like protein with peptidoglycan-binding domain